MTAIALIPIIATILRIDAGLAYLDQGMLAGLRIGDVGTIFYEMPVGGEPQRIEVSRGVVIDVDELGATVEVEPEFQVLVGYSIEFEVPHERVDPPALLDLARSRLRVRRDDEAAIQPLLDRLLPEDRMVERQVMRLIDTRRQRRGEPPLGATSAPADVEDLRQRVDRLEEQRDTLERDLESARATIADLSAERTAAGPAPATTSGETGPRGSGDIAAWVMDWAQAWSDQRIDDYLALYAPAFRPANGMSREAWEAQRRRRLSRPKLINVALSSIETHLVDHDLAQAMFFQDYRSTLYQDRVFKRLTLTAEDGAWKILREEVVDVDASFALAADDLRLADDETRVDEAVVD